MRKTFLVMVNEIGMSLRRRAFVLFAFGVPLILGIIALVVVFINRDAGGAAPAAGGGVTADQPAHEGYVDLAGLIQTLPGDMPAGRAVEYPDQATAQAALDAGNLTGYYIIAPDYVQTGDLTYVTEEHNPLSGGVISDPMEWILLVNMLGDDVQLAGEVLNPADVELTTLAPAEEENVEDNWIVELFPTLMVLILYMVILMPAGMLVNAVTDEKKNRVMEVLLTSVSTEQMISGKILALGLLGLVQTALYLGVMWAVITFGGQPLNIPPGFEIPTGLAVWSVVYFLLGYAMYGAQLAGVGALAPDAKETRAANLVVMSPLIVGYMFNIVIITSPNGPVALALSLFPLTSPIAMIARMAITEVPLWQSVLAVVLQALTAVLIVRLVARLFRAQHLLSGQPFSVREYYGALVGRA